MSDFDHISLKEIEYSPLLSYMYYHETQQSLQLKKTDFLTISDQIFSIFF